QEALNTVTARAYDLAGADPTRATPPPVGRDAPPIPPGVLYKFYRALTGLAQPAASLWLGARTRRGTEDRARRSERFGQASIARPAGRLAWVHAASVGETNASLPLSAAVRAGRADVRFLLTTGSLTAAAIASTRLGPN